MTDRTDMVMMPREMTDEMASALAAELMRQSKWLGWEPTAMWSAMLSASPSTPIPVIAEAGERERIAREVDVWAWQEPDDHPEVGRRRAVSLASADRILALSTPATLDNTAVEGEALRARVTDLETSVIAFGAPWAIDYAVGLGLPEGYLHPAHYDILANAGARMDDFTRATLTAKTEKAE